MAKADAGGGAEQEPKGAPAGDAAPAKKRRPRHRKRVTTEPLAGTDPTPSSEPPRHRLDENDARLREDKPPHY
ncbi:MAG: hypothetical protein KF727_15510 [Microbacteriaceae bacterium]|nr:hypothetical protein [Microbacteriaceae bacterium]